MGRWFPGRRKGTPEQCAAYDKASRELNDNSDREYRAWRARGGPPFWKPGGGVPESERYHELNDRAARTAEPLSRAQQSGPAMDLREARAAVRHRREQRQARRAARAR